MMAGYWEKLSDKIDGLSLRERVLIFAALAFMLVSLINVLFLEPLVTRQKQMATQVVQQQEKIKEIRGKIQALLEARHSDRSSPLRGRLAQLRQQLAAGEAYIKSRGDRLIPSDRMASVLEQILNRDGQLQLVSLKTLPVALLEQHGQNNKKQQSKMPSTLDKPVYQHGVQITVRGSYPELLGYLDQLEHLKVRMFWGQAKLGVEHYPEAELTLTLYTLSLDKTWLAV